MNGASLTGLIIITVAQLVLIFYILILLFEAWLQKKSRNSGISNTVVSICHQVTYLYLSDT